MSMPSFIDQVETFRRILGMTRSGLAERSGLSPTNITHYLNGKAPYDNPGMKTMQKLAEAVGCDVVIILMPRKKEKSGEGA